MGRAVCCACIVYSVGSIAVGGSDFLVGECVCRPFSGRRLNISDMVSSTTCYLRARHCVNVRERSHESLVYPIQQVNGSNYKPNHPDIRTYADLHFMVLKVTVKS